MDQDLVVTVLSALVAAVSFAAFALPFLNRTEKSERFRSVIEKRRKALFEATRDGTLHRADSAVSGKDSMATFYKVQKLAGEMGERVRDKMLQAGIRSPSAPLKFMIAQVVLPVVFCVLLVLVVSSSDAEISSAMKLLMILAAAFSGYKLPDLMIKNQIQKRQQDINLAFPDSLDMMLICVQGGIGLEQTIDRVAHEIAEHSPILAEELGILSAEMAMLNDRRQALQGWSHCARSRY